MKKPDPFISAIKEEIRAAQVEKRLYSKTDPHNAISWGDYIQGLRMALKIYKEGL